MKFIKNIFCSKNNKENEFDLYNQRMGQAYKGMVDAHRKWIEERNIMPHLSYIDQEIIERAYGKKALEEVMTSRMARFESYFNDNQE